MASVPHLIELMRAARYPEALRTWESFGKMRNRHPTLLEVGAALHEQLDRPAEAARLWRTLAEQLPNDPRPVGALAAALDKAGRADQATDALVRFSAAHRGVDPTLDRVAAARSTQRAVALEAARDLAGARSAALAALECDPSAARAERVLVRLDHQEGALQDAKTRALALAPRLPPAERAGLLLELAVIAQRLGEVELAWTSAADGNALALAAAPGIDLGAYPALVQRVRAWRGAPLEPVEGPGPVWMVGFPRSGTTLTQQILEAHPRVCTLDELDPAMTVLRNHLRGKPASYPACLDALQSADWAAMREAYGREIAALGLPEHDVLVDKLPLNLVRLDFLTRLFPGSKVLMSLRDPRDCVLSNLFQDYALNGAMAQFTSLDATVALYASVMGLWTERRTSLPVPWLELRYEDLTADPEGRARELLRFLGVEWDAAVLAHHEQARTRVITTPSRYEVSRPVHRRAVGRWRAFRHHLEPVLPALAPFAEAFGYEPD
ncbi:MAG: sulfotransferase [Myxococcota bacterium]